MTSAINVLAGAALRRHRLAAGMSLDDAAEAVGRHPSMVSRVETGQRGIAGDDLRVLLEEYRVSGNARAALELVASRAGWWSRPGAPRAHADLFALASCARKVTNYEALQVPFLAWTPGYAEAAVADDPSLSRRARDLIPGMALDAQKEVLRNRRAPVRLVIGEAALYQRGGGSLVMREQFRHLAGIGMGRRPEVSVVPLRSLTSPAPWAGSVTLLEFGGGIDSVVHLGGPGGGVFGFDPVTVRGAARVLGALRGVGGPGGAQMIEDAARQA